MHLSLYSQHRGYRHVMLSLAFHRNSGDLNSDPHAYRQAPYQLSHLTSIGNFIQHDGIWNTTLLQCKCVLKASPTMLQLEVVEPLRGGIYGEAVSSKGIMVLWSLPLSLITLP